MSENKELDTQTELDSSLKASIADRLSKASAITKRLKKQNYSIWAEQYNASQWCYFFAGFLVLYQFLSDGIEGSYILAGWIAFLGLARELLHLFQRIWETTLGKSAVLILYASTANIALAYAAMKINLVTGVEPTPFVFTLGFTTLVLMPFWIALSTVLVFSVFLVLVNLWLLVRLPLKLIGLNIQLHWEDKKRALLTMALRIVLIPFAIGSVIALSSPYFADYLAASERVEDISEEVIQEFASEEELEKPAVQISLGSDFTEQEVVEAREKGLIINKLIANFIWYFEAYPNSYCTKPENVRTIPLEELMVLFISRDENAEVGFRYQIAECLPAFANE